MSDVLELLSVFNDNDEVMSWCDRDTYEGAETYAHLAGLYASLKEAVGEVAKLRAEIAQLRVSK